MFTVSNMSTNDGLVISLATTGPPVPSEVGGRGASLIRLRQAGMNVPAGVVLTSAFFEPWLAELRESGEWLAVLQTLRSFGAGSPNASQRTRQGAGRGTVSGCGTPRPD